MTSIYPGTLVMRPRGTEALMAYGIGEYRWGIGTDYTTRLARLIDNKTAFLDKLSEVHFDGEKEISITRVED